MATVLYGIIFSDGAWLYATDASHQYRTTNRADDAATWTSKSLAEATLDCDGVRAMPGSKSARVAPWVRP